MNWLEPVALAGRFARLQPLALEHCEAMVEAAKDGELWDLWYTNVPRPEQMSEEIQRRLDLQAKGSMLPFAILDAGGSVAGMTTFMHIDAVYRRVEIGSTWLARRVQRTGLNTECKLMLMTHAFETLDCIAVEFRTSFLNHQSRRAIERLGAKLDGVLRSHQRHRDGTLRDTCVYSIIRSEWPSVKTHLQSQLGKS